MKLKKKETISKFFVIDSYFVLHALKGVKYNINYNKKNIFIYCHFEILGKNSISYSS